MGFPQDEEDDDDSLGAPNGASLDATLDQVHMMGNHRKNHRKTMGTPWENAYIYTYIY